MIETNPNTATRHSRPLGFAVLTPTYWQTGDYLGVTDPDAPQPA